ncbi:hypothetical protein BJ875DRAFT_53683 [Amylocarpus encephaloides]|uniref:Uncharacterized protein n=1 Tax=Amylocarpus encephaloides TaxID=45428 RepID=A0A9P7YGI8_9HELO|nr:hypothetical protein BJ875DRAFT_53683 [Amylocarpus encephaloides]
MTEQMGTPGSNADTSVNGGKTSAPKDKGCPFCHQQFTSSSLGRHLDLYIKERNPKPPDGIHNVEEIRRMRGGITRRQPRNSTSRREGSTPAGTPCAQDRRSPGPESVGELRSPSARRDDEQTDRPGTLRKPTWKVNSPSWEATGVMNVIPAVRNGESVRSWDNDERDGGRKLDSRQRSVSKQMFAKTTFEQKQKMMDALDNSKAAELALRELFGAIRAAKTRIDGPSIFNYDPLTLDFPALCLHCLPPPPTLYSATPMPSRISWSLQPPDDQQYEALREHFSQEFNKFRISCQVANSTPDDLSYPPPAEIFASLDDPAELASRAEADATEFEGRIGQHLHAAFVHWDSLPRSKRQDIWVLEMARGLGRKSEELSRIQKEKEFSQQEAAHLKLQVDELSRLQHPREFRLVSPTTVPINKELIDKLGELGTTCKGVGFDLMDRHVHLDVAIDRAIERWKSVVREARGNGGLAAQRSLSGESAPPHSTNSVSAPASQAAAVHTPTTPNPPQANNHVASTLENGNSAPAGSHNGVPAPIQTNGLIELGSDADADADADMDDDDSYMEMNETPRHHPPEATMPPTANFRLTNGNGNTNGNAQSNSSGLCMDGQVVQGYLRIGA